MLIENIRFLEEFEETFLPLAINYKNEDREVMTQIAAIISKMSNILSLNLYHLPKEIQQLVIRYNLSKLSIDSTKKYEYRKSCCKRTVFVMLVYVGAPIKKVLGEVEIKGVINGTPEEIWKQTYQDGGIRKEDYFAYFKDSGFVYTYVLKKVKKYTTLKNLSDIGVNYTPQSYTYIKD